MNVCAERLRRACYVNDGEGVGEDVAQACANDMGGVKWTGAQGHRGGSTCSVRKCFRT